MKNSVKFSANWAIVVLATTSVILPPQSAQAAGGKLNGKPCPFEQRTVGQVVSETNQPSDLRLAQASSQVAQTEPTKPETESPAATEAVERVRAIYKQICSSSRQVEQPQAAPTPVAAPIEAAPAPIRALW